MEIIVCNFIKITPKVVNLLLRHDIAAVIPSSSSLIRAKQQSLVTSAALLKRKLALIIGTSVSLALLSSHTCPAMISRLTMTLIDELSAASMDPQQLYEPTHKIELADMANLCVGVMLVRRLPKGSHIDCRLCPFVPQIWSDHHSLQSAGMLICEPPCSLIWIGRVWDVMKGWPGA